MYDLIDRDAVIIWIKKTDWLEPHRKKMLLEEAKMLRGVKLPEDPRVVRCDREDCYWCDEGFCKLRELSMTYDYYSDYDGVKCENVKLREDYYDD